MSLRERWSELDTAGKVLVGFAVGGVVFVVGVVLLVILAAVVGSFVLGLGSSSGAAPPAASMAMAYDSSAGAVEITHETGDSVDASDLRIEAGDRTVDWTDQDGIVTAGDSTTLEASPGTTVRVVWTGDGGSAELFRGDVEA